MLEWLQGQSFDPRKDIPNLSDKVILITGGNTGLGKECILQLARHEPKEICLAARTPLKAQTAIKEIQAAVPASNISYLQIDLSSFTSIKKAAEAFAARSSRLDILLNNAGAIIGHTKRTEDGYEPNFAVNYLGPYLLTKLLLPLLLRTAEFPDADVRIVNVSSVGHWQVRSPVGIIFDQDDLSERDFWNRYGQAKLSNILHAKELQKRHPSITATSVHPGVILTDLFNAVVEEQIGLRLFLWAAQIGTKLGLAQDITAGVRNQLWAATARRDVVRSSSYWRPVGVAGGESEFANDGELGERLWEWTEKQITKHGF